MEERRRNVRAKPTADLPSQVVRELTPGISDTIEIVDISVSGVALALLPDQEALADAPKLKLVLDKSTYDVEVAVRWRAKGMVGLELVNMPDETAKAVRRYVGELLERGRT